MVVKHSSTRLVPCENAVCGSIERFFAKTKGVENRGYLVYNPNNRSCIPRKVIKPMLFSLRDIIQKVTKWNPAAFLQRMVHPHMNGVAFLILFAYIAIVFLAEFVAYSETNLAVYAIAVPLLLLAAFFTAVILDWLFHFLQGKRLQGGASKRTCWYTFFGSFFAAFVILAMHFYGFFPGAFSHDSEVQLTEALTGVYSDWHPFVHTFLFFTIPLRLFGAAEMIVFLQILYFSIGFAYLMMTLRRYGCPQWFCVVWGAFLLFTPATGNFLMYPWKDCGLAIFSMITTAHYFHIVLTKGQWLKKKRNIFACGLFWALTTLVRHNAVLFVVPIVISALWFGWKNKKRVFAAIALFLTIFAVVKGPIYQAYSVEKPGYRLVETTGMCMVIMGNAVVECPEALDAEVLDFLYRVSPREVWEEKYYLGHFNDVKSHPATNANVIEEAGLENILGYTWKTFRAAPIQSLKAFFKVTGMIWQLTGDRIWEAGASASTEKTELILNAQLQGNIRELTSGWNRFVCMSLLEYPMYFIGWQSLALIAFSLAAIRKWSDLKRAFIGVPLLCHNFGTALLLTGFDWRFFFITFPITIPMLFLIRKTTQEADLE